MFGNQGIADEFRFVVLLENVPGTNEIEDGKTKAGIKLLKDQLNQVEHENSGDIWSTLCAAYIVSGFLDQANRACNKAVEVDPTNHALNNRGVFRVHNGELSKAREDFDRVRPPHVEAYLDKLKVTETRLVAASNFELINKMLAERAREQDKKDSDAISIAAIEDLSN
jgi:tetratricopeptide (TPR) repeat protein